MGGFFKWIMPGNKVTTGIQITPLDGITIGQQHWVSGFIGNYLHGKHGHNIRAIREEGDAAKPLGFTLSAVHGARAIQPHHRRVQLRLNQHLRCNHTVGWQVVQ